MMTAVLTKRLFTWSLAAHSILSACTKHTGAGTPAPTGPAAPAATASTAPLTLGPDHVLPAQLKESSNYPNTDWEDITADATYIYIGDTGNNDGDRTDLKILRIKKSDLATGTATISVTADAISFSYADQSDLSSNSNINFDCEAMMSVGDSLYLFTKDREDLQTRCYQLPKTPGTFAVSPVAAFNTRGKVTDAAYDPAIGTLALLGYMDKKNDSFIWFFSNYPGESSHPSCSTVYY